MAEGRKGFEVRLNDRGYRVGDRLHLREWLPREERYTGRECHVRIVYVMAGGKWLEPGYWVLGIERDATPDRTTWPTELAIANTFPLQVPRAKQLSYAKRILALFPPPEVRDAGAIARAIVSALIASGDAKHGDWDRLIALGLRILDHSHPPPEDAEATAARIVGALPGWARGDWKDQEDIHALIVRILTPPHLEAPRDG